MVCPIAGYKIDERAARLLAGFVVAGVAIAWIVPAGWSAVLLVALGLDFLARAVSRPSWSLLARVSRRVLGALGIGPRMVDAGPKRFAARIGLGFCIALVVAVSAGLDPVRTWLSAALAGCAALEAVFGFCVGCHLHGLWHALPRRFPRLGWRPSGALR